MPLRFYPGWVNIIANITPFPHMFNTVIETYLGVIQGAELFSALLIQLIWSLGLIALGQIMLRAGVRRLVIQGG